MTNQLLLSFFLVLTLTNASDPFSPPGKTMASYGAFVRASSKLEWGMRITLRLIFTGPEPSKLAMVTSTCGELEKRPCKEYAATKLSQHLGVAVAVYFFEYWTLWR